MIVARLRSALLQLFRLYTRVRLFDNSTYHELRKQTTVILLKLYLVVGISKRPASRWQTTNENILVNVIVGIELTAAARRRSALFQLFRLTPACQAFAVSVLIEQINQKPQIVLFLINNKHNI